MSWDQGESWHVGRGRNQNQAEPGHPTLQFTREVPRPAGENAGLRNDAEDLRAEPAVVSEICEYFSGTTEPALSLPKGVPAPHNLFHFVPWIMGVAEDSDGSLARRRFSPKKMGEMSQAAFLLKAQSLGFGLAVPWGDSEKCDFIVWAAGGGRLYRVQVKGTGRLHRGGYDVQPVYSTRGEGKKSYTALEIDVLAARVVIEGSGREVWYLLPVAVVEGVRNLRLFPELRGKNPRWEGYREAWEWLGG